MFFSKKYVTVLHARLERFGKSAYPKAQPLQIQAKTTSLHSF